MSKKSSTKKEGPRPIKKRVLIPVKLDSSQEVNTMGVKGVDGFLVTLSAPGGLRTRQITVHKALGQLPPEMSEKWVATPTSELHYLMENRSAPAAGRIIRQRQEFILDKIATAGLTLKYSSATPPVICYTNGTNRDLALSNAQKAYNKAKTAAKKDKDLESPQSNLEFLTDELFKLEQDVSDACKDTSLKESAKEKFPMPEFETKGGPLQDRFQVPIGRLGDSIQEAMANFEALVLSMQEAEVDDEKDDDPPELKKARHRAKGRRRTKGVNVTRMHRSRSRIPFKGLRDAVAPSPAKAGEGAEAKKAD